MPSRSTFLYLPPSYVGERCGKLKVTASIGHPRPDRAYPQHLGRSGEGFWAFLKATQQAVPTARGRYPSRPAYPGQSSNFVLPGAPLNQGPFRTHGLHIFRGEGIGFVFGAALVLVEESYVIVEEADQPDLIVDLADPNDWSAKTLLRLILRRPMQMRPRLVARMERS